MDAAFSILPLGGLPASATLLPAAPRPLALVLGGSWGDLLPWLVLVGLVGLGWVLLLLARLLRALEETRELTRGAVTIHTELREGLNKLVTERGDIDLRRLEHVLIDQREALTRLEDALLTTVEQAIAQRASESRSAAPVNETPPRGRADELGERIVNRLLAMGYERVHLAAPKADLEALDPARGEVLVEAQKLGVVYKGSVVLSEGRITDVDLEPPYAIFP